MTKYWEMWVVTIINWIWHETENKKSDTAKIQHTREFQMRLSYQLNGGEVLLPP